MSKLQHESDIISGCHIFTEYPVEEFTFTWHITNYSKIITTVTERFSTFSGATKWELTMYKNSHIELRKKFKCEVIRIQYACSLFSNDGMFKNEGECSLGDRNDLYQGECSLGDSGNCVLMDLFLDNLGFKDDLFKFQCTLTILGHTLSSKTESSGSDLANIKQLSRDMSDLFEKQEQCDLTMSVGQDRILVHKCILCARSPVFSKMFRYSMLENDNNEIELLDIEFDVLREFLTFLYSGELMQELSWDRAMRLYYAADKYEVMGLRKRCSEFLEFNLDVDRVCEALKLADMHKDEKLKDSAMRYARTHASVLKSAEDWQELLKTHPKLAVEIFK